MTLNQIETLIFKAIEGKNHEANYPVGQHLWNVIFDHGDFNVGVRVAVNNQALSDGDIIKAVSTAYTGIYGSIMAYAKEPSLVLTGRLEIKMQDRNGYYVIDES